MTDVAVGLAFQKNGLRRLPVGELGVIDELVLFFLIVSRIPTAPRSCPLGRIGLRNLDRTPVSGLFLLAIGPR
jgi:hypothetical protein